MRILRLAVVFFVVLFVPFSSIEAQKKGKVEAQKKGKVEAQKKGKVPRGLAKKDRIPPGHAKRGCLPPGLAKKFGEKPPCKVYIAVDPAHEDRAWFLIGDQWILKTEIGLDAQKEVQAALKLEIQPPPLPSIPLPKVEAKLQIMLFSD